MTTVKLHYAYPSSPIGGKNGCFYTQGANGKLAKRIKYETEFDAINDIAKRYRNSCKPRDVVVEFQFGGPDRADPFRKFGAPAIVVSAMDFTRPAA